MSFIRVLCFIVQVYYHTFIAPVTDQSVIIALFSRLDLPAQLELLKKLNETLTAPVATATVTAVADATATAAGVM